MKKTIKIKIGGILFHIDDDAYELLKNYLDSLTDHFRTMAEGKEVMEDIESRIAEIFQSKVKDQKEVISREDVVQMVGILGEAKDIIEEDKGEDKDTWQQYQRVGKRVYRDPDNAVLGGVCSGLGEYLNIDPIWVRLIFVVLLLAYGLTFWIYIILWIVLPKAETAAQKLEMKGENVTIQNIEKSVKKEYNNVKGNFRKMKSSQAYDRSTSALHEIFRAIGQIILVFVKIILAIIGVVFILAGFLTLISFLGVLIFGNLFFFPDIVQLHGFFLPEIFSVFSATGNVLLLTIAFICAVSIPLIALIYGGIKLIFRFRAKDGVIGLIGFVIWLISLGILASVGVSEGVNFREESRVTQTFTIDNPPGTLYLQLNTASQNLDLHSLFPFGNDKDQIYINQETKQIYGKPILDVVKSESGKIEIEVIKHSNGRNYLVARNHARALEYHWQRNDSILVFDPYFKLQRNQRWRNPYIKIKLKLPEGEQLYMEEDMRDIIYYIKNTSHSWYKGMVEKTWVMTPEGLTEINE